MLIVSLAKPLIMQIKYYVETLLKMFFSLDPNTNQYFVLTPEPIEKDPPKLFESTPITLQ